MTDLEFARAFKGLMDDFSAGLARLIEAMEGPVVEPPVDPAPTPEPDPGPVDPEPVPEPEPTPVPEPTPEPTPEPPAPTPIPVPPIVGGAVAKDAAEIAQAVKDGKSKIIVRKGALGALMVGPGLAGCVIVPEDPSDPATFSSVKFVGAQVLALSGFKVCPTVGAAKKANQTYLVTADAASSGVVLDALDIMGRDDAADCMAWAQSDWLAWCWSGVQFLGAGNSVIGCDLAGLNFGLSTIAPGARFNDNTGLGFSGDGIRLNGSGSKARRNRLTDFVLVDSNHPDAIQAFGKYSSATKTYADLSDLTIEDNEFIEWTVRADNPLRAKMQGIGGYNGRWLNSTVRRNRILTTSFTGISVANLINGAVEDNYFGNIDGIAADCARFNVKGSGSSILRNQSPKYIGTYDATNVTKPF